MYADHREKRHNALESRAHPNTILYLVPDLGDPAVARRVAMLGRGGAQVAVAGFHRSAAPPASVAGSEAVALGQTSDGALVRRIATVRAARRDAAALVRPLGPAGTIVARNLEMLAVAGALRATTGAGRLVYEVLDIHRLLLGHGPAARLLRAFEGRLAASADLLLTSSPAFVRHYFDPLSAVRLPVHLVENKPLGPLPPAVPRPPGPPWRIGLFGALRCRRSIDLLAAAAAHHQGRIEIVLHGRPSPAVFPDLLARLAAAPHIAYQGPYRPDDLPALYGDVHFTWAIDEYEAGANSEWLLPNRLYEGGAFGTVPIAREGTETAHALRRLDTGIVLADVARDLDTLVGTMTPERYRIEAARAAAVPRNAFVAGDVECAALVAAVTGCATVRAAA